MFKSNMNHGFGGGCHMDTMPGMECPPIMEPLAKI